MRTLTAFLLLCLSIISPVKAQTGTYRLNNKTGASCIIALTRANSRISADVFAWWHTQSGRNGALSGKGIIKNNTCILKSPDDPDCTVTLLISTNNLKVKFSNCISSNLPDDFSGVYQKITDQLPGDYTIAIPKAWFYKTAGAKTRLKTYLIKGNKVSVDLENISDGQWVFINFTNAAGKTTSGYLPWSALKIN